MHKDSVSTIRPQRDLIALPSLEDLKLAAQRNEIAIPESTLISYRNAQRAIHIAHIRMARAALRIVNPDQFTKIETERRHAVYTANDKAAQECAAFFTETCTGFLSEE